MKFFFAENINSRQIVTPNKRQIKFESIGQFAGSFRGIFKADKPDDEAGLTELAKDPKSAVREITEAEYEDYAKKKAPTSPNYNPLPRPEDKIVPTPPAPAIISSGAVLVEDPSSVEATAANAAVAGAPIPEAEALETGSIEAPAKE